jgi:hypothetical protein
MRIARFRKYQAHLLVSRKIGRERVRFPFVISLGYKSYAGDTVFLFVERPKVWPLACGACNKDETLEQGIRGASVLSQTYSYI